MKTLLIGIGGALGSMARYQLDGWIQTRFGTAFPWGTLAVNVLGCLAAGAVAAKAEGTLRLFLIPGVLGGFTTFSAFGLETQALLRQGGVGPATAYVALSLGAGLGAVVLGGALSR